jgi:hypothetical protein
MPPAWEAPTWINRDEITAAYDYYKAANQDKPWWEWKYLHPQDPGRAFLQGIKQPPNEMLWPSEGQPFDSVPGAQVTGGAQMTLAPGVTTAGQVPGIEQIPSPAEAGLTPEQYDALPTWQKWVIPVLNSPFGMGVVQSLPFAVPLLAAAPFTGGATLGPAAGVLALGAGMGLAQEPKVTELIQKYVPAAAGLPKTLADAMYYMFGLAPEALERVIGLGEQAYGTAINPEKYGSFAELTQNLPAAWRAAHLTLETTPIQIANIFPMISGEQQAKAGEIWGALGQPGMGAPIPAPPMGIEALAAFRRSFAAGEVKTLLDQGQLGLEQINAFLAGQYGFSGQLNELVGQTALFFIAQEGQHRVTRFGIEEYARLRDNPELLKAAKLGGGRPVETLQAYGTKLMGKPNEELARMGAVERWLTNVSKEGEYLGLVPGRVSVTDRLRSGIIIGGIGAMAGFALGGPGGALAGAIMTFPIGFKSQYMAQLRPAAQANEVVNGAGTIAAGVIAMGKDDPRIIDRYVTGLANTPLELSRELSVETIMSPVGSALPLFMKDVAPQVHDLLASYEASRPQAGIVEKIARVLGIKPEEAIQELQSAKDANNLLARVVEKARAMVATDDNAKAIVAAYEDGISKTPQLPPEAQLTADNLKSITKMFAGDDAVPLSPTDFKSDTWNIIMSGADEWAAKWFNIQPEPTWARLGATMKAAQSVVLLGLNPTFLINNFLNNFVTMAARGNFGLRTPETIARFWERVGIEPARLKAGIGPTALGVENFKQAIRAATVKPGFLTSADRFLSERVGKFMLMSKLSMEAEKMASQQAQTHSFIKAMNILHREGVGFDRLPGPLEDMLNTVNPKLSNFVYAAIKGGLSQAEVEANLWTDFTRLSLDQGIPRYVEEARRAGVDVSETSVRSMLTDLGIFDLLNERLKAAGDNNEQINSAFNEVDRVANDWLNEQSRGSLQKKAVDVAVKVKTEGFAGVVKLWDEMQLGAAELWHQHFMDWQVAMDQASRLTGEQARAVIIAQRSAASQTWDRAWKSQSAEILGIFEGLGIESQAARDTLGHFIDQADTWKAFYASRDKLTDRFFNTDYADAATRTAAWRDLSEQLLKMYVDAGVDEVKHQNALDNAFVEQMAGIHGDEVAVRARVWRDRMLNFYKDRAGMMSTHRQSVVDMTPDERRMAWPKFLNDQYMPYLRQFFQEQINGAHELYGYAKPPTEPPTPTVPPMPIPPTAPPAVPAAPPPVVPAVPPVAPPAEIPFIITRPMREQLSRQSYSANEIASMTPREAQANIDRGTPNPDRVAASFPAPEPTPERQNTVAQVRQVASEAGYATSDENGFYVPGADRHILNAIKVYGGPEAAGYESLADVSPEVATRAFKNKETVLAELHKVTPDMEAHNRLVEMSRMPSEELADYIKTPLRQIAEAMKHDLYGGLVLRGKANEIRTPEGTVTVPLAGSENMEWYAVLYNSGIKSKGQVEAALNRITEGTDTANLKAAQIIKEVILRWMTGDQENFYTDARPGLLLDLGREQDAVTAYNKLFETGEAGTFTDAQWVEYAGNADILAKVQDLWGQRIAAQPQPHPVEAAQEGFIMGAGRTVIPPETQAIMDAITQREHLLNRLTEIKTTVDNGVSLLSAGDAREMLRKSATDIFGYTREEADTYVALTDARAQVWANRNGRSASEWYSTRFGGLVQGGVAGEEVLYQAPATPIWYSQLQKVVESIPQERLTAEQLRGMIAKGGVKADELKWTGFDEWLKGKTKITRQEALDYLNTNRVNVEETVRGVLPDTAIYDRAIQDLVEQRNTIVDKMDQEDNLLNSDLRKVLPTEEAENISNNWTRGGEERARQVLGNERVNQYSDLVDQFEQLGEIISRKEAEKLGAGTRFDIYQVPGGENYRELLLKLPDTPGAEYVSPHWDQPNVLAHVRFNDRTSADGKKVLFVEEVQSDWHQAGREKGYGPDPFVRQMQQKYHDVNPRDLMTNEELGQWVELGRPAFGGEFVPPTPFAKTWPELTMKRVLRWAAENGYDQVAWTTGEQQADRYRLSRYYEQIRYRILSDGTVSIWGTPKGEAEERFIAQPKQRDLADYLGVDIEKKILDDFAKDVKAEGVITGEGLKVGGAGMRAFYDEMLPNVMNKYAKKWGARVGETKIETGTPNWKVEHPQYGTQYFRTEEQARIFARANGLTEKLIISPVAPVTVHSLDITPEMRQSVLEGQPLFQGPKGAIEFLNDGRAIIHAMEAPDVSTLAHEIGHIFRRDLEGADLRITEEWAGVQNGVWEAAHEEKFARGFERYLAEGIAPTTGLRAVFENFKRWLLRVYTAITGSQIDIKITPELRGVFDRLLSEAPTIPPGQVEMFRPEQVMPLFTGTPMRGQESIFRPTGEAQPIMPGLTEAYVPKFGEGIRVKPYEGLIPGTTEWLAFWNAHPELQQEMLQYRSQWFDTDTGPKRLFQGQVQSADGSVEQTPANQQLQLPGMGAMGAADGLQTQAPIADILDNGYTTRVKPILDGLKRYYLSPESRLPTTVKDLNTALPLDVARDLRSYLGKVYGQMTDTKLASIRYAEMRRDSALLNYNKRYGFDNVISFGLPYEFWYTRNALNWALGAIDNPLWMGTYANLRRMQRNMIQTAGFPTRLKDKMKISMPFLPEWMGGGVYVDPLRQIFPFEQLARPWEQAQKDQDAITRRAEQNIQQMVHDEEISQTDAQAAIQDHAGLIWEKAYTQAKIDTDADTANPYEFINLMMGWALPIQWAYYGLTGQKEKINALPITRMVNAVTSSLGMNKGRGINLEGPIRRTLGMPELNQYDDYRVDRMLANMAAEGIVTADDATRAMLDRTGPAFLQAQQRVAQMGAWSYFGAPAAVDFFPEGEATQRALQGEYQKALEVWMKDKNSTAMQDFFDKYPEYEARMALYRDPESRLKQFLISEVWNRYNGLPDLYKKQLRDQLGDLFNQAFLQKETRSYDSINTQTLSMWAQIMGSTLPTAAGTIPEAPVTLASPQVAQAYQDFRDAVNQKWPSVYSTLDIYYRIPPGKVQDAYAKKHPEIDAYYKFRNDFFATHPEIIPYAAGEESKIAGAKPEIQKLYYVFMASRDRDFPGVMQLQDQYYNKPAGKERTAFRSGNPMLTAYWDWRREFMRQYPQMIPYLMSTESLASAVLNEPVSAPAVPAVAAPKELQEFTPALLRALLGYYQADQPLSAGAQKELQRIWTQAGRPTGDLKTWLEQVVKPLFVQ